MPKSAKKPVTPEAVSRIYSATAKKHGGEIPKDSFAARAKSALDRNNNEK